jgi:hypothetical protein
MKGGYVAIITVLIIAMVGLAIVSTYAFLGIGEGYSGLSLSGGENALEFSEGCMEDALLNLRANASYAGGTIARPDGSCTISISSVGNVYTVTSTATLSPKYNRTIQVIATRGATQVTISSWKEK